MFAVTSAECFQCGGPAGHKFGNNYLCESCIPSSDVESSNPEGEGATESSESDTSGTFEAPTTVFPEQLKDVYQWVCWKYIDDTKKAFAPWSDRDHTDIDPETDARYSWSLPANWTSFTKAKEWASMVPDIDGVGFVLQKTSEPYTEGDADPFAFIEIHIVEEPFEKVINRHCEQCINQNFQFDNQNDERKLVCSRCGLEKEQQFH